jgi:hypothetical protein
MIQYVRLLSDEDYGRIMRLDSPKEQYIWDVKKQDWIKTGYFVRYTQQEDWGDRYEFITLGEALKIISDQK